MNGTDNKILVPLRTAECLELLISDTPYTYSQAVENPHLLMTIAGQVPDPVEIIPRVDWEEYKKLNHLDHDPEILNNDRITNAAST